MKEGDVLQWREYDAGNAGNEDVFKRGWRARQGPLIPHAPTCLTARLGPADGIVTFSRGCGRQVRWMDAGITWMETYL